MKISKADFKAIARRFRHRERALRGRVYRELDRQGIDHRDSKRTKRRPQ